MESEREKKRQQQQQRYRFMLHGSRGLIRNRSVQMSKYRVQQWHKPHTHGRARIKHRYYSSKQSKAKHRKVKLDGGQWRWGWQRKII